jgi:hypothetical protein
VNACETKTTLGTISLERTNLKEELIFKHRNFITNCGISLIFAIPKNIGT